jgi:hypothetical protein
MILETSRRSTRSPTIQGAVRAPSREEERPGLKSDHSPPSNAQVKNQWSHTFAPPVYLHGVHNDKVTSDGTPVL